MEIQSLLPPTGRKTKLLRVHPAEQQHNVFKENATFELTLGRVGAVSVPML